MKIIYSDFFTSFFSYMTQAKLNSVQANSALETRSSPAAVPATARHLGFGFGGISGTRIALAALLSALSFDLGCAVEVGGRRLEVKKTPVTVGFQNPGISLSKTAGEAGGASDCPEADKAKAEFESRSKDLDTATDIATSSDIASRETNGIALTRAREAVAASQQKIKAAEEECKRERNETVRNFFGL